MLRNVPVGAGRRKNKNGGLLTSDSPDSPNYSGEGHLGAAGGEDQVGFHKKAMSYGGSLANGGS